MQVDRTMETGGKEVDSLSAGFVSVLKFWTRRKHFYNSTIYVSRNLNEIQMSQFTLYKQNTSQIWCHSNLNAYLPLVMGRGRKKV